MSLRLWKCGAFHPSRAAPARPPNHSSCCSVVMTSGRAWCATVPSGSAKRRRLASPAPPMPRGATAPKNGGTSTPRTWTPRGSSSTSRRDELGSPQGELGREPSPEAVPDDVDLGRSPRRGTGRRGARRSPRRRRSPRARCWRCTRAGRAPSTSKLVARRARNGVHRSPAHTAWMSHNPCRYSTRALPLRAPPRRSVTSRPETASVDLVGAPARPSTTVTSIPWWRSGRSACSRT